MNTNKQFKNNLELNVKINQKTQFYEKKHNVNQRVKSNKKLKNSLGLNVKNQSENSNYERIVK